MKLQKALMVAGAILIPVASVSLVAGPAFAKKVTGTGSVTCSVGGTANFNPPLSANGSPASKEVVTITGATLSNCSGGTPSAASGGSLSLKPLKIKGTGKPKMAGSCSNLASGVSSIVVKTKTAWANGAKPTKTVESNFKIIAGGGEEGFGSQNGTATGSYAGSSQVTAYFTQSSSASFATACGGGAPLSSAQIDPSTSSFTF